MEKYVQVSASFHIQNPFGIQSFHFFFLLLLLLQYFCSLLIAVSVHWLIFCTCLIFIAYLKFTEPKTDADDYSWSLVTSCCDFENPLIQICSQITACQAFIAGLIPLYSFLNVWGFMFYCISPDLRCCVELNAYVVQTGPRWQLGLILKHFTHYYPKIGVFFFFLNGKPGARKTEPLLFRKEGIWKK